MKGGEIDEGESYYFAVSGLCNYFIFIDFYTHTVQGGDGY
jgi:hypothetical protein